MSTLECHRPSVSHDAMPLTCQCPALGAPRLSVLVTMSPQQSFSKYISSWYLVPALMEPDSQDVKGTDLIPVVVNNGKGQGGHAMCKL